ncbi:MAG: sugar phosphate nucleotidyltransferase, partial [Candidatus Saelkia tenebricola]|nr:sugar phosphate nucleotidyltransferase [Candidatus Saelkia tenebricola]
MAGGKGARLHPLTRDRAKPAVPFGGIFRIIDFTLSNCINSDLRKICVLTQYKSVSLMSHIYLGWNVVNRELNEFIEVIPAQQRIGDVWYRGTADSIYQNIYKIEDENPTDVFILGGDHVYKMDYSKMLQFHKAKGADLTVGVFQFKREKAKEFGIIRVDNDKRVKELVEKPSDLTTFKDKSVYVSMGIYIYKTDVLKKVLHRDAENEDSNHDFGRNVIPAMLGKYKVYGFVFNEEEKNPYWRDIGTLDAYYEANMELVKARSKINLYDAKWPIRTYQGQFPPAKVLKNNKYGSIYDSIISHGCIIKSAAIEKSVLSYGVKVLENARVTGT